jgi:hypothetical protein
MTSYSRDIYRMMATILRDPLLFQTKNGYFDPQNLRRKGKAANSEHAFNGWMIRELSDRVPAHAPNRATAIADLLELVDIDVTPQTVGTILRRPKT